MVLTTVDLTVSLCTFQFSFNGLLVWHLEACLQNNACARTRFVCWYKIMSTSSSLIYKIMRSFDFMKREIFCHFNQHSLHQNLLSLVIFFALPHYCSWLAICSRAGLSCLTIIKFCSSQYRCSEPQVQWSLSQCIGSVYVAHPLSLWDYDMIIPNP